MHGNQGLDHLARVPALVARERDHHGAELGAAQRREQLSHRFGIDFFHAARERYLLACRMEEIDSEPMRQLLATLRGPEFRAMVASLAGYECRDAGEMVESLVPVHSNPGP